MFYLWKCQKSCLFLLWKKNLDFMFTCTVVVQSSLLWQHCAHIIYRTEKTDSREQHGIIPIKSPQPPNPKPKEQISVIWNYWIGVCLKNHLKNTKSWNTRYYECISLFSFSNKWNLFCFFLNWNLVLIIVHCIKCFG